MNSKHSGRRRFLKEGAALAGLAVGAIRSASAQTLAPETPAAPPKDFRAYGERSRFVDSVRTFKDGGGPTPHHPHGFLTPIQDSVGIITPSSLHFWEDHGYNLPDIEPRQHRLTRGIDDVIAGGDGGLAFERDDVDPVLLDQDQDVAARRLAGAVDEPAGSNGKRHGMSLPVMWNRGCRRFSSRLR